MHLKEGTVSPAAKAWFGSAMRLNLRTSVLILALLSLTSCYTASQTVTLEGEFGDWVIADRAVPVEVISPGDASYKGKLYTGSGRAVALRVQEVARSRFADVQIVDAKSLATAEGRRLRVEPTILHWEDRNTPWSGLADEVRIRLEVSDTASGQRRALEYYAHSTWWTFVDDPPEDLLNEPRFGEAVLQLLPAPASTQ